MVSDSGGAWFSRRRRETGEEGRLETPLKSSLYYRGLRMSGGTLFQHSLGKLRWVWCFWTRLRESVPSRVPRREPFLLRWRKETNDQTYIHRMSSGPRLRLPFSQRISLLTVTCDVGTVIPYSQMEDLRLWA